MKSCCKSLLCAFCSGLCHQRWSQWYRIGPHVITPSCRYVQFRTLRDVSNRVMKSTLTIMTPMTNTHFIMVDGQPPATTWKRVGGDQSDLPMAMAKMPVSDGAHYITTAELDSAFTAWLMIRKWYGCSSMSLGNTGRWCLCIIVSTNKPLNRPNYLQLWYSISTHHQTLYWLIGGPLKPLHPQSALHHQLIST